MDLQQSDPNNTYLDQFDLDKTNPNQTDMNQGNSGRADTAKKTILIKLILTIDESNSLGSI